MMTGVSTLKTPKSLITAVSVSNASGQVDKREMNRDERYKGYYIPSTKLS
jgi:hypothetical protein